MGSWFFKPMSVALAGLGNQCRAGEQAGNYGGIRELGGWIVDLAEALLRILPEPGLP